ncbi:MAG: hypothetical protein JW860_06650 [Sedimentisphaerales bacterium]|nr:hypothetical protein [Sedimentisphaerales bacterium]
MSIKTRLAIIAVIVIIMGVILLTIRRRETASGLVPAFNAEFLTRPDGYEGLCRHYEFRFPVKPRQMAEGLMYRALADGAVDVIDAFSTDGRIQAYDLVILEDDKNYFPPYYAAPLVRAEALDEYPQIEPVLNLLAGRLSYEIMQQLNYRVDEEGHSAYDVAFDFLTENNFITLKTRAVTYTGQVTIGSKEFSEQEILGELMSLIIEYNTDLRVNRKLNLGGTLIAFEALKAGDIDLYAEYTGTGLVTILKEQVQTDPDKTYQTVREMFLENYNLIWLRPLGFNNTYTLTMRKNHARKLGLKTISDLARMVNNHP